MEIHHRTFRSLTFGTGIRDDPQKIEVLDAPAAAYCRELLDVGYVTSGVSLKPSGYKDLTAKFLRCVTEKA
jgi:hypothetical protein